MEDLKLAVEVSRTCGCPSALGGHALAGATVILNPPASDEVVGKAAYRERCSRASPPGWWRGMCTADAGMGESSTDMVFAGHNLIAENGGILAASKRYEGGLVTADLDVQYLAAERMRMNTFGAHPQTHLKVPFHLRLDKLSLDRFIDPSPFVPFDDMARDRRCEDILDIQVHGLMTRLRHTAANGGGGRVRRPDSTLALLVAARAFERPGASRRWSDRGDHALLWDHPPHP